MSTSHLIDPVIEARKCGRRFTDEPSTKSKACRSGQPRQAPAPPDDDLDAYDIPTFCRRHKISTSFYFKLRLLGMAPRTMKLGKRVLISKESAAAWRREREAATTTAPAA